MTRTFFTFSREHRTLILNSKKNSSVKACQDTYTRLSVESPNYRQNKNKEMKSVQSETDLLQFARIFNYD